MSRLDQPANHPPRRSPSSQPPDREGATGDFRVGEWLVRAELGELENGGAAAQIEPRAMDLLVYLAERAGQVIRKERLIQAVWPDAFVTDEVLTNSIYKLRQALGDDPKDPQFIRTIPKRGYQLIAPVSRLEPETRYRVGKRVGRGAMGEVYRCHDTLLRRTVALKFLPEEAEREERSSRRLLREARAAAALDHPHICQVYDTGELNGRTFIAMELLEGETLKARLKKGPLPLREAIRIASEIAQALQKAHGHGIVHRDIKPSNIMIRADGHAKVMDFGVAKRMASVDDQDEEWTATLTSDDGMRGTLPYMSPEQLRNQGVDARSDIFSLGVLLYEMITGVHPFRRQASLDTAAAILGEEPAPLADSCEEATEALQRTIGRMLAKDRQRRFQSVQEASDHLAGWRSQPEVPPASTEAGLRRWSYLAVFPLALVVLIVGWRALREGPPDAPAPAEVSSIAVLPLANRSGDSDQDYFADGLTDDLITTLARTGVKVTSATSAMRYKHRRGKPLAQIARELKVDAIVEGSVLRIGNQAKINARLIHAETDGTLWADTYELELTDLLQVFQEVSAQVARSVSGNLAGRAKKPLPKARKVDPEAYDLYLKGLFLRGRWSGGRLQKSLDYLRKSVAKDPDFARAHVALAAVYSELAFIHVLPQEEAYWKARQAARKALEIDETSAEAWAVLGSAKLFTWDWKGAEQAISRALELNRNQELVRDRASYFFMATGRHDESVQEAKRALELNPFSLYSNMHLAWSLYNAGRHDEAIERLRLSKDLFPDALIVRQFLAWNYESKGLYDEALAEQGCAEHPASLNAATSEQAEKPQGKAKEYAPEVGNSSSPRPRDYMSTSKRLGCLRSYALADRGDEAREALDEWLGREENLRPIRVASIFAALGDEDLAFDQLEKAYENRDSDLVFLKSDHALSSLRGDPRFSDLVRRVTRGDLKRASSAANAS